jgi:hypothetical protein
MVDFDFLKGAATSFTALAAAAFFLPKNYVGLQDTRLRVAARKRRNLDALLKDARWKSASALELELAFTDAFGFVMPDRLVRFALASTNATLLVRDLKRCQLMVRLSEDGLRLVPAVPRTLSFRKEGVAFFVSGVTLPFLAMVLAPVITAYLPMTWVGALVGAVLIWLPSALVFANRLESAHRVTALGGELYPADRQPSAALVVHEQANSPVTG